MQEGNALPATLREVRSQMHTVLHSGGRLFPGSIRHSSEYFGVFCLLLGMVFIYLFVIGQMLLV